MKYVLTFLLAFACVSATEIREVDNIEYDFQMPLNVKVYDIPLQGEAYRMVGDVPVCDYVDGKLSYDARDLGIHEFDSCPDLRIVPLTEMHPVDRDRNGKPLMYACEYGKVYHVFWTDKSRLCPEAMVRFKTGLRTIDEIYLERDGIESTDLGMASPIFTYDDEILENNPDYEHKVWYAAEHGGIIANDITKPKPRW